MFISIKTMAYAYAENRAPLTGEKVQRICYVHRQSIHLRLNILPSSFLGQNLQRCHRLAEQQRQTAHVRVSAALFVRTIYQSKRAKELTLSAKHRPVSDSPPRSGHSISCIEDDHHWSLHIDAS